MTPLMPSGEYDALIRYLGMRFSLPWVSPTGFAPRTIEYPPVAPVNRRRGPSWAATPRASLPPLPPLHHPRAQPDGREPGRDEGRPVLPAAVLTGDLRPGLVGRGRGILRRRREAGDRHRRAEDQPDPARERPAALLGAGDGGRDERGAGLDPERGGPTLRRPQPLAAAPGAFREQRQRIPAAQDGASCLEGLGVGLAATDREGTEPQEHPRER